MRTYARKKITLALAFLCVSSCLPPAFATSPALKQQASEAKPQPSIEVRIPIIISARSLKAQLKSNMNSRSGILGTDVLKIERVQVG